MKKILAITLLALLAVFPALAEAPRQGVPLQDIPLPDMPFQDAPTEDAPTQDAPQETPPYESASGDQITLEVNGETVRLVYDSSPQYSSVQNGLVQASYYAYGSDGVTMYELYIIFPDSAKPGMVITPEYSAITGEESSVVLIVSDQESELYYLSSLMDGSVYPAGSDYSIAIDDIAPDGAGTRYSGSLSANLVALDMASGEVAATLQIDAVPFAFTLGAGDDNRHADPLPTEMPGDMRKA